MSKPEEPHASDEPGIAWRSQPEEKQCKMEDLLTPDKLCAMAHAREKLNTGVLVGLAVLTAVLSGALLYNVFRIDQPWIRLGQAWTLGVLIYLFGPALERRNRRSATSEPCAQFLEREHEERRCGYLRIRQRLFLFIPGMISCWWGTHSTLPWRAHASPWLFVGTIAALILAWFAFGKAAEKAARDQAEVLLAISN